MMFYFMVFWVFCCVRVLEVIIIVVASIAAVKSFMTSAVYKLIIVSVYKSEGMSNCKWGGVELFKILIRVNVFCVWVFCLKFLLASSKSTSSGCKTTSLIFECMCVFLWWMVMMIVLNCVWNLMFWIDLLIKFLVFVIMVWINWWSWLEISSLFIWSFEYGVSFGIWWRLVMVLVLLVYYIMLFVFKGLFGLIIVVLFVGDLIMVMIVVASTFTMDRVRSIDIKNKFGNDCKLFLIVVLFMKFFVVVLMCMVMRNFFFVFIVFDLWLMIFKFSRVFVKRSFFLTTTFLDFFKSLIKGELFCVCNMRVLFIWKISVFSLFGGVWLLCCIAMMASSYVTRKFVFFGVFFMSDDVGFILYWMMDCLCFFMVLILVMGLSKVLIIVVIFFFVVVFCNICKR